MRQPFREMYFCETDSAAVIELANRSSQLIHPPLHQSKPPPNSEHMPHLSIFVGFPLGRIPVIEQTLR